MKMRNVLLLAMLAILSILLMVGCSGNPAEQLSSSLEKGDYSNAVTIYNSEIAGTEHEAEVNDILVDQINALVDQWDCEEMELDDALAALRELSSLKNETLAMLSKDNYDIVNVEGNGKILLTKAEECYADDDFGNAMKYCLDVDPSYSLYDNAMELYNTTESVVLETVSMPYSSKDCKDFAKTLDGYLSVIDNKKFMDRKSELEKLTGEYDEAELIVDKAAVLYDDGKYERCFTVLSDGLKQYPDNNLIAIAQDNTKNLYIIQVTQSVLSLCEKKEYKDAMAEVDTAINIYDCEEFANLKDSVKKQKNFLYRISSNVVDKFKAFTQDADGEKLSVRDIGSKTGSYVMMSGKKIVLGDYAEEEATVLSFTGNVMASVAGVDLMMDLRDVTYDLIHWGEEEYFLVYLAADTVALIPVIGAIKYFDVKNMKKTIEAMKQANHVDEVSDIANTIIDTKKTYKTIGDAVNSSKKLSVVSHVKNRHIRYVSKPTINARYKGEEYKGVPFTEKKLKYSNGSRERRVVPEFEYKCEIKLKKRDYLDSREEHFKYCNEQLQKAIKKDKELRQEFSTKELQEIENGIKGNAPSGYTWHHNEEEGVIQLVDAKVHSEVRHTGGYSMWGAGSLKDAS